MPGVSRVRGWRLVLLASLIAGALPLTSSLAGASTWTPAQPLATSLNLGGYAQVLSVSCAGPGQCVAGGYYEDVNNTSQALIVNEVNGVWGAPTTLAGSLNMSGAQVTSVACDPSGHCVAGGYYEDASTTTFAFVADEVNGNWVITTLPSSLDPNGSQVNAVACEASGHCVAGGYYETAGVHVQAFVMDEVNGTWGAPSTLTDGSNQALGDLAGSNGYAQVNAVACDGVGYCVAGGYYYDASTIQHAFVVDEVGGVWSRATSLAQASRVNATTTLTSLACDPSGHCVAGGMLNDAGSTYQAFVADEVGGLWTTTPIATSLNTGGSAETNSVACDPSGHCVAGGMLNDAGSTYQAFVADEVNGTWSATTVAASLNGGGNATVWAVACSAGQCEAGGYYDATGSTYGAFIADEVNGVWAASPVATSLNARGGAGVTALTCSAGQCLAGGNYVDSTGRTQAFITQNEVTPGRLAGLSLTRSHTTVSASWTPNGSDSYTCTLMYGYSSPSSFHVTTTSGGCAFYGVSPTQSVGVRVVATSAGVSSAPVTAFVDGQASITCVRNSAHRVVTGASPRCPAGWRRR